MKAIKINAKNITKLQAAIDDVEGQAKARTISAYDLHRIVEEATENVEARTFLPKTRQIGVQVGYRMGLQMASSYRYAPMYTSVVMLRRSTGWFLADVQRLPGNPRQAEQFSITLPADLAAEAQKRFESGFYVRKEG